MSNSQIKYRGVHYKDEKTPGKRTSEIKMQFFNKPAELSIWIKLKQF